MRGSLVAMVLGSGRVRGPLILIAVRTLGLDRMSLMLREGNAPRLGGVRESGTVSAAGLQVLQSTARFGYLAQCRGLNIALWVCDL